MLLGSGFRSDQATGQDSSTDGSLGLFEARQSSPPPPACGRTLVPLWCIILSLARVSTHSAGRKAAFLAAIARTSHTQCFPELLPHTQGLIAHRSVGSLSLMLSVLLMMLDLSPPFSSAYFCTCSPELASSFPYALASGQHSPVNVGLSMPVFTFCCPVW